MALAPGLKRRGGLFGSSPTVARGPYDTPGFGDGVTATQQPMAHAKSKFFGEGGVGRAIAGNIGDFLLQQSGMDPIYAPVMQQRQAMAYDQQQREIQRRQGLEDWAWKQEQEAKNRQPTYFDDNAGNRWAVGADGKPKLVFRDPNAKRIPQKVTGQNGEEYIEWIEIPNNVNDDGTFRTPQAGPAVGAIEDGFRFKGGDPADPNSWEPADNSPPPISSAPSRPNTISRTAYQAWVNQYGREEADSIMRRNGFTVGNY